MYMRFLFRKAIIYIPIFSLVFKMLSLSNNRGFLNDEESACCFSRKGTTFYILSLNNFRLKERMTFNMVQEVAFSRR